MVYYLLCPAFLRVAWSVRAVLFCRVRLGHLLVAGLLPFPRSACSVFSGGAWCAPTQRFFPLRSWAFCTTVVSGFIVGCSGRGLPAMFCRSSDCPSLQGAGCLPIRRFPPQDSLSERTASLSDRDECLFAGVPCKKNARTVGFGRFSAGSCNYFCSAFRLMSLAALAASFGFFETALLS